MCLKYVTKSFTCRRKLFMITNMGVNIEKNEKKKKMKERG